MQEEENKNKKEVKVQEAGRKRRSRKKSETLGDYFGDNRKGILTTEFGDSAFIFVHLMCSKGRRQLCFAPRFPEDNVSMSN